jgi:hypothetical protein
LSGCLGHASPCERGGPPTCSPEEKKHGWWLEGAGFLFPGGLYTMILWVMDIEKC